MTWTHAGQWGPEGILDQQGDLLLSISFKVYNQDATTLATLHTDPTKATTAANPTQSDALGNLTLYVDPGKYYIASLIGNIEGTKRLIVVDPYFLDLGPDTANVHKTGNETIVGTKDFGGLRVNVNGSVVTGGQGPLANAATDGFLYVPVMSGTPTAAPTDQSGTSALVYDEGGHRLWIYDRASSSWQDIAGGGPGAPTWVGLAYQGFIPGQWYTQWGSASSDHKPNGYCSFMPLFSGPGLSTQTVGVRVVTSGTTGSLARLGLYSDNGQGKPDTLVRDFGVVGTTTTGNRTITASITIGASLVWLACAQQGGATTGAEVFTLLSDATGYSFSPAPCLTPTSNPASGWSIASGVTGVLPTTPSGLVVDETPIRVSLQAT